MTTAATTPWVRAVRSRPAQAVAATDLRSRAQALLDEGSRLALVTAVRSTVDDRRNVVYLFTAPRPDRRVELVTPIASDGTVPSLALLTLPAGRFERELYETHGILASSADAAGRAARTSGGPIRTPATRTRWEADLEGRPVSTALPQVERAAPAAGFAHAVALCLAVEDAHGDSVPAPVAAGRALLVELERMAGHLGLIASMCAGAGLSRWSVEALALRDRVLQLNQETAGHRLLRGATYPGGVHLRSLPGDRQLRALERTATELSEAVLSSPAVHQTYRQRWLLTSRHAAMTGALGCVARASGIDIDARRDHPFHAATTTVEAVTSRRGDALARLEVRLEELRTGLSLIRDLLPDAGGAIAWTDHGPPPGRGVPVRGIGLVEGPRGTIVHRVELDPVGRLAHVKVVDPGFLTRAARTLSLGGVHDEHGSRVPSGFES